MFLYYKITSCLKKISCSSIQLTRGIFSVVQITQFYRANHPAYIDLVLQRSRIPLQILTKDVVVVEVVVVTLMKIIEMVDTEVNVKHNKDQGHADTVAT